MQDGLIRAIPMRHGSNSLVQPQTEVPAQALQNQIMVFQSAGGQPLCNIRADGNLAGFAAIVQALLAVYILWLVMEADEAYPTASTLETRDAHHHALQTGLGGILGEIFCHGCLPLSEHKRTGAASLHIRCRCGPCSSNFTYPFVVPARVPASACPPGLGQCIQSLSLQSVRL